MASSIIFALGPGDKLDSLSSFAPDYLAVRRAFNELLVFPHLEAINVGNDTGSEENLFTLVSSGTSRFSELSNIDVDLARKVISYNSTLSLLLDSLSVQLFVLTMEPVAKGYADHARAGSEANQKFFAEFSDYISTIDDRIAGLHAQLLELDVQIQQQSEALANRNIVSTLWEVLKTLYKLASTAEESDVQIAAILGVAVSTIYGSFKSLFQDRARLQRLIDSLQALRNQLSTLKTKFIALSNGLTTVTTSSKALLDVWDDVAARLQSVENVTELVPTSAAQEIKAAWAKVAADAAEYIKVLSQPMSSAVSSYRILATEFNAIVKIPLTATEIRLHKLAVVLGNDTPFASGVGRIIAAATNSDEEVIEKVIGPPADTQQKLEELADSTGKIIDQFNNLLQTPYLDQLKCTSPIDGSESNLYVVMNYYREKYLKLQQDTLPVARNLGAYATLQQTLLPMVVRDNLAKPGEIPMSHYIATNKPLVEEYLVSANELSKRSTEVKNDWDNAINLVQKSIAECDANIKSWSDSVYQLTEEQKKATLYASLSAFGAFLAFTLAAFLPGIGILVALGAGGALGGLAVWQAIQASKITEAINDLKKAIRVAEDTKAKLQTLLSPMQEIAQDLSKVSQIWSDIATALTNLSAFYTVLDGPTGQLTLETLKPSVIENWKTVGQSVQQYIAIVSK